LDKGLRTGFASAYLRFHAKGSLGNKRRHFSRKEERWHRYSSATYPDMRLPHALPPLLFAEKFHTLIFERALSRQGAKPQFFLLPEGPSALEGRDF
jgi:hypothetical protein